MIVYEKYYVTARLAVEAGVPMDWERYVGGLGVVNGMTRFGASAPGGVLMEKFRFTAENLIKEAVILLKR